MEDILARYDYTLPSHLIAQAPLKPRDSAKILVYNRKQNTITYDTFYNLAKYLPPHSVVVFNETKVIPARLTLTKETGGKVTVLYLGKEENVIKVMADRKLTVGQKLTLSSTKSFTVVNQQEQYFFLKPSFPVSQLHVVLQRHGVAPLPPYIKHSPLTKAETKKQYQTVFAKHNGSVAAPTASLHFTKRLLNSMKAAGHDIAFITLHVNLGTFAPLTKEQLIQGKLHTEQYEIPSRTVQLLNTAKAQGRPIVAVGTTVVRALESATEKVIEMPSRTISGNTDIFIRPGYQFRFVDHLITNFHVPQSSLMMLVAAFLESSPYEGEGRVRLLQLYQNAISHEFRFFSFGDGMLIL